MANESPAPLRFAEPVPGQASSDEEWLDIESLDLDGQGVAHRADGKVVFVEGALPFEKVRARRVKSKGKWERAILTELRVESSQRVQPACPHFGLHDGACGGCKIQHLDPSAQVAIKQRALEDALWHVGKVRAENILRPIEGPALHYRYRARLSVRHVVKKGAVLVGFHERKSSFVADMQSCVVLPKAVSDLLLPLRELIASMEARDHCPQIELACGEREQDTQLGVIALVLRHLKALDDGDRARLRAFALRHPGVQWWLQSAGPGTVCLMDDVAPGDAALGYALPEFGTHMAFRPTDFTQVNPQINRVLVSRALRLLDVQRHERVIDWFCGLGNFTLPLATRAGEVLGIEGSAALVMRSAENLERNKAFAQTGRSFSATKFVARDLFAMTPEMLIGDSHADAWLIDPPREGAFALVKSLAVLCGVPEDAGQSGQSGQAGAASDASGSVETQAMDAAKSAGWTPPRRIVYVSCNPATLARDAGLLQQAGFRCRAAGVVNMFPHTAHVESIALFERS